MLSQSGFAVGQIIPEPFHDPDSLLQLMGLDDFTLYIHSVTRRSRLEIYEMTLLEKESCLLSALEIALTPEERLNILKNVILIRKRLQRVTTQLMYSSVIKFSSIK